MNHTVQLSDKTPNTAPSPEDVDTLARAMSSWYVRMDGKYFDAANPNTKFSRDDIQTASIHRFRDEYPGIVLTSQLLAKVFETALINVPIDRASGVPTWNGRQQCLPGNPDRFEWQDGMVALNAWTEPAYRRITEQEADLGTVLDFLTTIFPVEAHRDVFLNWLAWCLQNEGDKPTWGPLLYSKRKGTGKSTLCDIVSALFGWDNSVRQNNVDKLTSRFNKELMLSKLVISEELDIKPGTRAGNALKTFMTETDAVTEAKGREVQRIEQRFCCMFTTNHLPMWIEEDDRRYWIVEIDHPGHSDGPEADAFNELVGNVKAYIRHDAHVARLYRWLMERPLPEGFTGKAFDVARYQTPVMELIFGNGTHTAQDMMREHLDDKGYVVLPEADVVRVVTDDLKASAASTKHLMTELGWRKTKVKWGGKDFARAIWVRPGYNVERGHIHGPNGFKVGIDEHEKARAEEMSLELCLGSVAAEEDCLEAEEDLY